MGLGTIAAMLYLDEDTVRQHERLLIEYDLVEFRPNGRLITRAGKQYLLEQSR
jgi:Holliday junction resolvasome RuvABC ATP-dependent DNA helicase subunit